MDGFSARLTALDVGPSVDAVHVWRVDLDLPAPLIDEAAALLTADELASIHKCSAPVAQAHIVARGALRVALSTWVDRPPTALRFRNDKHGKPHLTEPTNPRVAFSVSRCTSCCLIAVSRAGLVGVDVEDIQPLPDLDEITRRYFAWDEAADILRLSGTAKRQAFYRCWVHKEAYLKARGIGLQAGLATCSVAVHGKPALRRSDDDDEPERWTLATLELGESLAGAVATRQPAGHFAGV